MVDDASMGPYYRESGSGPGVVCLHSNASTSGQWGPLMDRLSDRFRVLAPDTLGAGQSPPWPTHDVVLTDEVALLQPVFARAGDPFSLVGHSYGAAVALIAAVMNPDRIRSMVLYEPTLFSVLYQESPEQQAWKEIRAVVDDAVAHIEEGDRYAAAERFIDYWAGPGSFHAIPEARQQPVAESIVNIGGWAHALFYQPTSLEAFRRLDMPVLYLVGEASPASSRGVARLLTSILPQVEVVELERLGHLAPVTHPQIVNELIDDFLERSSVS